ncbi:MAG TPA: hypothetical protein VGM51_09580 [Armatimonadota bacterium]|jgi:hypothetical protein
MITCEFSCPWLEWIQHPDLPTDVLQRAGESILDAMRKEIQGGGLTPLAPSTLDQKARHGGSTTPLAALLDSLTRGGRDNVLQTSGWSVEAGSADPVAVYHIRGTRRMPRRDFTAIDMQAILNDAANRALDYFIQGGPA